MAATTCPPKASPRRLLVSLRRYSADISDHDRIRGGVEFALAIRTAGAYAASMKPIAVTVVTLAVVAGFGRQVFAEAHSPACIAALQAKQAEMEAKPHPVEICWDEHPPRTKCTKYPLPLWNPNTKTWQCPAKSHLAHIVGYGGLDSDSIAEIEELSPLEAGAGAYDYLYGLAAANQSCYREIVVVPVCLPHRIPPPY